VRWGCGWAAALAGVAVAASLAGWHAPVRAWPTETGKTASSVVLPVAVFGSDDRVPAPAKYRDVQEKIGLLFSVRGRSVCTAFCVAKDVIATAGHCLHGVAGDRAGRIGDFWFARNFDVQRDYARIAGHASGAAAQHVMSGSMRLNVRPPIDASKDWALIRLSRPACSKGALTLKVLGLDEIVTEAAAGRVFQIAYHRDFTPWKPAISRPCGVAKRFETADWATISHDFANAEALILHTCDTGGASSGSPMLLETADGPVVIGINVGTYVQAKVLMQAGKVAKRLKSDTVANTGVASSAFADKIEPFRQAAILSGREQMRELQSLLYARGLFAGKADGSFGAELRSAIEAFEQAESLPLTGLATAALLQRLGGGAVVEKKPAPVRARKTVRRVRS
jgi:protease YdgD